MSICRQIILSLGYLSGSSVGHGIFIVMHSRLDRVLSGSVYARQVLSCLQLAAMPRLTCYIFMNESNNVGGERALCRWHVHMASCSNQWMYLRLAVPSLCCPQQCSWTWRNPVFKQIVHIIKCLILIPVGFSIHLNLRYHWQQLIKSEWKPVDVWSVEGPSIQGHQLMRLWTQQG